MNCATSNQRDTIIISEQRRNSLVEAETLNMLEKQVNRLNIERPVSAKPGMMVDSPRNSESFLRSFSTTPRKARTLDPTKREISSQYIVPSFDDLRKRRCSEPDISGDKKLGLPPLNPNSGSRVSLTVRPRTTIDGIRKKSLPEERRTPRTHISALRQVASMSSLSTHSAPDIHVSLHNGTPRPRSGSPFRTDKSKTVFERLCSPIKRTQTSNSSESEQNTPLPRRGSTSNRLYVGHRRRSVPHETLKLAISNSTGTISPSKRSPIQGSNVSYENDVERNTNSESSSPKSDHLVRLNEQFEGNDVQNVVVQNTCVNCEQESEETHIDEETSSRIIQWLLGVEKSSKIIPENKIEDEATTETAIRIIYPGD
ncbi:uncharacterized protein LOC144444684 [Glandiceps talaboti]